MRVLLTHRYYWPDVPPYADMLRDIRAAMIEAGCAVDVFSTQPSYSAAAGLERQPAHLKDSGGIVTRIAVPFWSRGDVGKLVSAAWYSLRVFFRVLSGPHDVVMAATTPPVLAAWLVSLACMLRGKSFVYHFQDIHPEILSGQRVRGGLVKRILRGLDRQSCRRAAKLVVLSKDMANVLVEEREADPRRLSVINNFFRGMASDPGDLPVEFDNKRVDVLFTGNIGRFQGLDWLLDCFAGCAEACPELRLTLLGDGKMLEPLRQRAASLQGDVRLPGRVTPEAAQAANEKADVAVISLRAGMSEFAFPSKMMAYACAGTRILAVIEPQSELAEVIREHRLGWVVSPGDADGLGQAFKEIAARGQLDEDERTRIRKVGDSLYGKSIILAKWQELVKELGSPGSKQ